MAETGRHTLRLDDLQLVLMQDALMAYHAVLSIQTRTNDARRQGDRVAKLSAKVQGHFKCDCPPSDAVAVLEPDPRPPVPIEDREVI